MVSLSLEAIKDISTIKNRDISAKNTRKDILIYILRDKDILLEKARKRILNYVLRIKILEII